MASFMKNLMKYLIVSNLYTRSSFGHNFQVIGLDFSKKQLQVASTRQHIHSKACYNIKWALVNLTIGVLTDYINEY